MKKAPCLFLGKVRMKLRMRRALRNENGLVMARKHETAIAETSASPSWDLTSAHPFDLKASTKQILQSYATTRLTR